MQQIPFIDLFKSALHVPGDKPAHPQEHFFVSTVKKVPLHSATNSPIFRSTFLTCRADLKRSINGICCILLVAYIVVLMTHGLTNINNK